MTEEVSRETQTMSLLQALTFARQKQKSLTVVWYRTLLNKLENRLLREMRHQSLVFSWMRSTNAIREIPQNGIEPFLAKTPLYVTEDALRNQSLDEAIIEAVLGVTNMQFATGDIEAVVEHIVGLLIENWLPTQRESSIHEFVSAAVVMEGNFSACQELLKRLANRGKL